MVSTYPRSRSTSCAVIYLLSLQGPSKPSAGGDGLSTLPLVLLPPFPAAVILLNVHYPASRLDSHRTTHSRPWNPSPHFSEVRTMASLGAPSGSTGPSNIARTLPNAFLAPNAVICRSCGRSPDVPLPYTHLLHGYPGRRRCYRQPSRLPRCFY